ncbi:MAG: hypothetical protein ACXWM7_02165 [Parachlamydiaceae bacterium]
MQVPATPILYRHPSEERNQCLEIDRFIKRHQQPQIESSGPKVSKVFLESLKSIGQIASASRRSAFIDASTNVNIKIEQKKSEKEKQAENHKAVAGVGALFIAIGTPLYYSFAGRIKAINREIRDIVNLDQALSADKTHIESQPGVKAFFNALEFKKAALDEERSYALWKSAAVAAVVASGIFAVGAFFLATQYINIAAIGLGFFLFAGLVIKSKEYFTSTVNQKF